MIVEFSENGHNPYRDVMEYNKLYLGLMNYAYETEKGIIDIVTNHCIMVNKIQFHNSDVSSNYWENNYHPKPKGKVFTDTEPVIIPHADDIRRSVFGENTGQLCGSVATEIILRYFDKNVKSGFIPSGYHTSIEDTLVDSRFLNQQLLTYLISSLGEDPIKTGTWPNHDAINANPVSYTHLVTSS